MKTFINILLMCLLLDVSSILAIDQMTSWDRLIEKYKKHIAAGVVSLVSDVHNKKSIYLNTYELSKYARKDIDELLYTIRNDDEISNGIHIENNNISGTSELANQGIDRSYVRLAIEKILPGVVSKDKAALLATVESGETGERLLASTGVIKAASAVEVKNFKLGQEGDTAVATYDLVSSGGEGVVEVTVVIIVDGKRRTSDQLSLSGDFGKNVKVGPGKRIVWNATADLPRDFDGELNWDVRVAGGTITEQSIVDEATLARGATPSFYSCNAHADCQTGNVCVDNGGDGHFYCKPLCGSDAACSGWPYPRLGCYEHRRADGTIFPYRVCNDQPSRLRP